jgi:dUTP pyrophosphatase
MKKTKQVKVKIVNKSNNDLPAYETKGAAGMDVKAHLDAPFEIPSGYSSIIPTGLYVEIPEGYEIQLRARSGLAAKNLIALTNGLGTLDEDFRGEIKVMLINHGNVPFVVDPGMRIGQMVLNKIDKIEWVPTDELSATERGEGGLGSTGA